MASPYSGLVTDQFVKKHDTVKAGDPLFVIDSPALRNELAARHGADSTAASTINRRRHGRGEGHRGRARDGRRGRGRHLRPGRRDARQGRPCRDAQGGGGLHADAERVRPRGGQGAGHDRAAEREALEGTVETVDVKTKNGNAEAVITVASKELKLGAENGLIATGTPVSAELHLRNDGVVSTVQDNVKTFFRGIF